ncbi:hypothetical protein F0562_025739 [Nyssa sinensis]|uniref:Uncharacterized protein n=1 Tax=Nyssa sinensis TaxID=561372 RepID=A0A5J5BBB5_9ASTE|nr:hypothetical protein F0562_025739 [Nyssa sinensis]
MKMVPAWQSFVYEQPSSFITAMAVINLLALAYLGISETVDKHLPYSKFWNVNSQISSANQMIKFSSRTAMLIGYTPAFLVAVASFVIFPENRIRFLLVKSALTFHFFKRLFEVLFVHRYSGGMALSTLFQISFSYFNFSASMIYIQHLSQGFPEPLMDLKCLGSAFYLIGRGYATKKCLKLQFHTLSCSVLDDCLQNIFGMVGQPWDFERPCCILQSSLIEGPVDLLTIGGEVSVFLVKEEWSRGSPSFPMVESFCILDLLRLLNIKRGRRILKVSREYVKP